MDFDRSMFRGKELRDMTREELYSVIEWLARENRNQMEQKWRDIDSLNSLASKS